ncbi:uncharacterized protein EAE97_011690 [Botrytis byssoidea]|uniref:Amidase domain-containing protein n=1 Tax=Botrytis byssoidea TaxID=139641 RepID=A0A9P5LSB9_9HELO|nr:uncharacterized protein EAE97_011690 [Botrytis byssoidea]KAF7919358.1 hypothetical protein EAE97_011690 [Botrytis byssoidea]
MILGILLSALVIDGVNSSLTTNTRPPRNKLPSLNKAGIEDSAESLEYKDFTSVDLIKANRHKRQHEQYCLLPCTNWGQSACITYIARKLREVGAIILGKTNPSQWGHFRSFNISNGWSTRGGQTYGPYFPRQDPSGSSSGSAVASTLGLATVFLGAGPSGSIIARSHFNSVVGMKPTVGLISRHLVVPVSEHMDTIGPMTKTVKDVAYVFQSIAGVDPHITIPLRSCMELTWTLSMPGAIIENTDFPTAQESIDNGLLTVQVVAADFGVVVEKYLDLLVYNPHNIIDLPDLREWTQSRPLEGCQNKPTNVWDAALQNWSNADYECWRTYQRAPYWGNEGGLLGVFERYKLEAVILPFLFLGTGLVLLVRLLYMNWFDFSFLGEKFTDAKLIGLAYAFEQRTMNRKTSEKILGKAHVINSEQGG